MRSCATSGGSCAGLPPCAAGGGGDDRSGSGTRNAVAAAAAAPPAESPAALMAACRWAWGVSSVRQGKTGRRRSGITTQPRPLRGGTMPGGGGQRAVPRLATRARRCGMASSRTARDHRLARGPRCFFHTHRDWDDVRSGGPGGLGERGWNAALSRTWRGLFFFYWSRSSCIEMLSECEPLHCLHQRPAPSLDFPRRDSARRPAGGRNENGVGVLLVSELVVGGSGSS